MASNGCPAGNGSGSVTSNAAPPIAPVLRAVDQGRGVHQAAPCDIDEKGGVLHHR